MVVTIAMVVLSLYSGVIPLFGDNQDQWIYMMRFYNFLKQSYVMNVWGVVVVSDVTYYDQY